MAKQPEFIVPTLRAKQWYLMHVPGPKAIDVPTLVYDNDYGHQTVDFNRARRTVEAMASIGATFTPLIAMTPRLYGQIGICAAVAEASGVKSDQSAGKAVLKWLEKMDNAMLDDD